jgi:hypothetical protein
VIEWIGYSNEAFLGNGKPGWSGFIDLNKSVGKLSTPGSDLNKAQEIIKVLSYNNNLSYSKVDLTAANPAALIFKNTPVGDPVVGYGWSGGGADENFIVKAAKNNDDTFDIAGGVNPVRIYEHYYLAHSAYAIVPEVGALSNNRIDDDEDKKNFNLRLYYNYRPWIAGEGYTKGDSALLATNVNIFRMQQIGSTIHLKLCLHDNKQSGFDNYIVACKEDVIL